MTLTVDDFIESLPQKGRTRSPPSHKAWTRSILDPGAPQYILPEFALVDIYSNLFEVGGTPIQSRAHANRSFSDTLLSSLPDTASVPDLTLQGVSMREFVQTYGDVVRAPERKGKALPHYPIAPEFAYYSGIRQNDPNLLTSQLVPAIAAGGDSSLKTLDSFQKALGAATFSGPGGRRPNDLLETIFDAILRADGKQRATMAPLSKIYQSLSGGSTPADQTFLKWTRPSPTDHPRTPAERLVLDLRRLSGYEPHLPRLDWVKWACAFVRTYVSLTCLWRTRAVVLVHQECDKILLGDASKRLGKDDLHDGLLGLREDDPPLLRANGEWTSQIDILVQAYAEARIAVNTILWLLSVADGLSVGVPADLESLPESAILSEVRTTHSPTKGLISMPYDQTGWQCNELLDELQARAAVLDSLAARFGCANARNLVRQVIDSFPKYTSVSKATWANNLREYVIYSLNPPRIDSTKDEYSLIRTWSGRGVRSGVKVIPAGGLLALLVQFVATDAKQHHTKPTLLDLTRLFQDLRVEFEPGPEGLGMLIDKLGTLGLLEGSPDALLAAQIGAPYGHI